jgi:hypothetical protein
MKNQTLYQGSAIFNQSKTLYQGSAIFFYKGRQIKGSYHPRSYVKPSQTNLSRVK